MTLQPAGNQYGQVTVSGGVAHLGDQYITVYQDPQQEYRRQWLQLLTSLRYDKMNARFNEISNAGQKTFAWIFNYQQNSQSDPSHLASWLKDKTPIFLVQGKAGSGKSTLMKFVFEHETTVSLLQSGDQKQPLMLLFHSFWIVGTQEQHSLKGFLASLAHQILSKRTDLLQICYRIPGHELKHSFSDWSEKNLRTLLVALCQSLSSKLCIFIDGLDEIDPKDELDNLMELITDLQQLATPCRFCLSSRPLPYILQTVGEAPGLRLQDLTKDDIFHYVHETLQQKASRLPNTRENQISLEHITSLICQKAEGVFLWVHYVLQNVCDGLRIGDDLKTLQKRIKMLPSAIGDLYRHMWNLQNTDNTVHAEEASMLFSFGGYLPMPLFQLCVALQPRLIDHYLRNMSPLDEDYLRTACQNVLKIVQHRSAGLVEPVEVSTEDDDDMNVEGSSFWGQKGVSAHKQEQWRRIKIQYIHRTVHDFLTKSEEGQRILRVGTASTKQEVDRRWLESFFACFIEDIRGFSLQAVYDLCFSRAWLSQNEGAMVNLVNTMGTRLMLDRRNPQSVKHFQNWVFDMRSEGPECYLHTDFPGLMAGISQRCMQHLLFSYGKSWSPYYKGYLALCAIIHTMWNIPVWRSDILRMLSILWDLKLAGADFITPHPYSSASVGVLAIRSPVVRLLQEVCMTILRPRDHRIGLDTVGEFLRLLADLEIEDQKFTVFWANHYDSRSNGFGVSPQAYPCCMIMFDVGTVLRAFSHVVQGSPRIRTFDDPGVSTETMRTSRLGQSLSQILPKLVECIRVVRYSSLQHEKDHDEEDECDSDDEDAQFAECAPGQVERMFRLMIRGREIDVIDEMNLTDIAPPSWPGSDLNFEDRLEDFKPFMEPLNPHTHIGLHNWMEEGCLKSYFATKRSSQPAAAGSASV